MLSQTFMLIAAIVTPGSSCTFAAQNTSGRFEESQPFAALRLNSQMAEMRLLLPQHFFAGAAVTFRQCCTFTKATVHFSQSRQISN
jgi:hypothetical protein